MHHSQVWAVHPRWRGEHAVRVFVALRRDGSSPLARGTLGQGECSGLYNRFIPAGAGNTTPFDAGQRFLPVHPRWRGEHTRPSVEPNSQSGSSPLARGTQLSLALLRLHLRFIPAGAGNTVERCKTIAACPVHPRWRGEHGYRKTAAYSLGGSSPLARGTRAEAANRAPSLRFIPAGAGNTIRQRDEGGAAAVHPRWRGEHRP